MKMPLPDNEQVNVEFVFSVEQFPVLYNYSLKDYSNRSEQEKAWRELATRFKATDAECKLRWKNIRGAFTRYIKAKNTLGGTAKKPYYLWDVLQFLLPYTKSRNPPGKLDIFPSPQQQDERTDELDEDATEEDQLAEQTSKLQSDRQVAQKLEAQHSQKCSTSPSQSLWRNSKVAERRVDPLENIVTQYLERRGNLEEDTNTSADLLFFKSLLPDIKDFSPAKKRKFKRKVIEIIDELSEDDLATQTSLSVTNCSAPAHRHKRPAATPPDDSAVGK